MLNLLVSSEAIFEECKIAELLNNLQLFFTVRACEHRIEIPSDTIHALPPTPEQLMVLVNHFGSKPEDSTRAITVLMTSRLIHASPPRELVWGRQFAVLSNYKGQQRHHDATTVWAARHLVHLGMSLFVDVPCQDETCVCNNLKNFLTLCERCENKLRERDYRDGIARLKDAINWLNQRYNSQRPDLAVRPLVSPDTRLVLAEHYAEQKKAEGKQPFAGKVVLMVLHFLSDLLPFVDALNKLGAPFSQMYLVAKPYPYAKRDLVSHELERRGVNVFRATHSHDVPEIAKMVLENIQGASVLKGQKIVVIEDGGYFAPLLHEPAFANLLQSCIGVVEQTTKGIRRDREKVGDKPTVPILSVAESKFKAEYESPEIGRVTIQNISRFVPNTKLSGRRAVVFGFGSIGEQVASQLNRSFNMGVSVVDFNEIKHLKALHRKDIVSEAAATFAELQFGDEATLVVGTTGECSIKKEILTALRDGCILASTSSDRVEIEMDALKEMAGDNVRPIEEGKTEYRISVEGNEKTVTVLADGYPINFYGSESLPNDTIDPIMTLLILCGIELCENKLEPIIHLDYVNKDIEEKYGLIAEFLRLCSAG